MAARVAEDVLGPGCHDVALGPSSEPSARTMAEQLGAMLREHHSSLLKQLQEPMRGRCGRAPRPSVRAGQSGAPEGVGALARGSLVASWLIVGRPLAEDQ